MVVDDMNNFESCIEGSRSYEQLKAIVDINDFMLWV